MLRINGCMNRIIGMLLFLVMQPFVFLYAQESTSFPFLGEIKADSINVRCDSTVSAAIICTLHKGEYVEVVSELYDWYKIMLPKTAPSFIRKDLVELVNEKTGRIARSGVNIRLQPGEASAIVGKARSGETLNILEFQKGWYKIEPVNKSAGWVNKKFLKFD